jgi:hypothetical protein
MSDPATLVALGSAATAAVGITAAASLRGWQDWLDLRRMELSTGASRPTRRTPVDISELRERVRRLEAIATGREI